MTDNPCRRVKYVITYRSGTRQCRAPASSARLSKKIPNQTSVIGFRPSRAKLQKLAGPMGGVRKYVDPVCGSSASEGALGTGRISTLAANEFGRAARSNEHKGRSLSRCFRLSRWMMSKQVLWLVMRSWAEQCSHHRGQAMFQSFSEIPFVYLSFSFYRSLDRRRRAAS